MCSSQLSITVPFVDIIFKAPLFLPCLVCESISLLCLQKSDLYSTIVNANMKKKKILRAQRGDENRLNDSGSAAKSAINKPLPINYL